jgi:SAM-dependent methyltransferase
MGKHDRDKLAIVERAASLDPTDRVLDVGCGAGTFLQALHSKWGSQVSGVDFVDLSQHPGMNGVDFHHGLLQEAKLDDSSFDLVTMWHFLEHDYDPVGTLETARKKLRPGGRLVIEVPRLDSLSFRLFRNRWPGLQAPQHTVLFDQKMLRAFVERAGFTVVEQLPWGAFPASLYLFMGLAFSLKRERGLELGRAIYPYFALRLVLLPLLLFERRLNLAMQTIICESPR